MSDPLASPTPTPPTDPEAAVREVQGAYTKISDEVHRVIVGQDRVVDELLTTLFCGGHALVVGVPGLAKTLLISTIAKTLSLGFSRIQFTPDLMPSDMTGTEVIEEDKSTGARELRFVKGPIFSNVILADEINRTPPKTQAALLEAMQERQVTAGGVRHQLPAPFFVLATQNPIEQEGTYPLPEAQLDRFMFNILIGYPTEEEEVQIVQQTTAAGEATVSAVLGGDEVLRVQNLVRQVPVADHVVRYALRIARATRIREDSVKPDIVRNYVAWGAGPRASQYLILAAKAKAMLGGSTHVMPEHVQAVALPVMRHRIITNFNAEADGISADDIIQDLVDRTPLDSGDANTSRQMDAVMQSSAGASSTPDVTLSTGGVRAENYLAPETLAQLAPFELRAKMIVEGVMSGMHRSPYQGMAVEFAQHRQYVAGDDPKHLDWKVFGRTDKLYIKQYQQETNLDVVILVDASSSMGYGSLEVKPRWGGTAASGRTKTWTKFDHATAIATALSYLCLQQQDRVGLAVFANEVGTMVKRSSAQGQWRRIVSTLSTEPVQEHTSIAKVADQVLGKITNRALFVILSDLFDDPESIRQALARFRHRRHDVVLMNTLDRQEMRFDFSQPSPFEGLEDEGRLRIDPRALRDAYLEGIGAHLDFITRTSLGFGFDHHMVDTHESVGPPLAYLLARRSAHAKRSKIS